MVNNLTNLTDAVTFFDIIEFNNSVTNGLMGSGFIITIFFIIVMVSMRKYSFEESILLASFFGFVLSIGLTAIGLVNLVFIFAFATLFVLDGFFVYLTRKT